MKPIAAMTLTVLLAQASAAAPAEQRPVGVVEVSEFGGNLGTLTKAVSGVPRAVPNPPKEALDRWRASAAVFTHGFAVSRGANGTESFTAHRVYEDELGQAHIRLTQSVAGLPVVGADLIVHTDIQTGKVLGVNGRFAIDRGLARAPRMSAGDAIAAAMNEYGLASAHVEGVPELTYIIDRGDGIRLAWTNVVAYSSADGPELDRLYADALTGAAIARHYLVRRAKNRELYDCGGTNGTSCSFLFGESGPSPFHNSKAIAAYNNAGIVYDYFWLRHGRDGLNGAGIVLKQAVEFGPDADTTAGWYPAGTYSMIVYGDGLGSWVAPLGTSLDIVGHEFTHGVVDYESSLTYTAGEQGSLHEGLADIFAVAIDAYRDGTPDWWIAEDIYSSSTSGDALRYLDDPARQSGQTDYYPSRIPTGTHQNAGISGLAFYLLSQGGSHPRKASVSVAGIGIAKAEKIFYRALAAYMNSTTGFRELRDYTLWAAADLYGPGGVETTSVTDAWSAVGNHWETQSGSLSEGSSWTSPTYSTTIKGRHTARVVGPVGSIGGNCCYGSNWTLSLEKWEGGTWTVYESARPTVKTTIIIDTIAFAGTFRWRVHATSISGSYTFNWNRW